MSRYVVDASVAIKWYLPEIHKTYALYLIGSGHILLAPDLILGEVGGILWKWSRKSLITGDEATIFMNLFLKVDLEIVSSIGLISLAFEIASSIGVTVYDCLYVSVAIMRNAILITADRKLYDALFGTPFKEYLIWIEDLKTEE